MIDKRVNNARDIECRLRSLPSQRGVRSPKAGDPSHLELSSARAAWMEAEYQYLLVHQYISGIGAFVDVVLTRLWRSGRGRDAWNEAIYENHKAHKIGRVYCNSSYVISMVPAHRCNVK